MCHKKYVTSKESEVTVWGKIFKIGNFKKVEQKSQNNW